MNDFEFIVKAIFQEIGILKKEGFQI